MLNKDGQRELAYVVRVDEVRPIEGYDRIAEAVVGGWHCIVPNTMKAGELAVYFEIDSLVPATDERFAFCEKYKYRIKTQRMCKGKVISQGLLMPLSDFAELEGAQEDDFVTEKLGVKYYEPNDNKRKRPSADKYKSMGARHPKLFKTRPVRWLMRRQWGKKLLFVFFGSKKKDRGFPVWVKKTDEERVQNMPWILESDEDWVATEKIDGTSTTFAMKRLKHGKYEYTVCSRNVAFNADPRKNKDKKFYYDTNVYLEMSEQYAMYDVCRLLLEDRPSAEWVYVQAETYGDGIQKRDYSLSNKRIAAFNLVYSDTGRLGTLEMCNILKNYGVPCVPIVSETMKLPKTVEECLAFVDGESAIDGKEREGIVFRTLDGQKSFKAVSNPYLLKYHG